MISVVVFEKRLSGWKNKLLSVDRRLVLINSNLPSLPMVMLFFYIPRGVHKKKRSVDQSFFWKNDQHNKKYRLVK